MRRLPAGLGVQTGQQGAQFLVSRHGRHDVPRYRHRLVGSVALDRFRQEHPRQRVGGVGLPGGDQFVEHRAELFVGRPLLDSGHPRIFDGTGCSGGDPLLDLLYVHSGPL